VNGGIVQMTAKNQKRRPEAKPDYELTKRELAVVSRFLNEQAEWAPRVKISGPEDPGVNSRYGSRVNLHGKIASQAGAASHRKSDGYAA
jgi:hypothetical protein